MTASTPRRVPNPWVAVPVLIGAAVGWFIGRNLARLTCESNNCAGAEITLSLIGAAVGFIGVLVVAILAVRSLSEWAEINRNKSQPPES